MASRFASINHLPILESDRKYHWPLGRRPEGHPGLSDLASSSLPPVGVFSEARDPNLLNKGVWMPDKKTAIVTGASQGIGAGLVEAFLKQGYNVVATSRDVSQSLIASPSLVLVDGNIGEQETAVKVVEAAIKHFGTIDVLVNNAGIFYDKPFTDFTTGDINALVSTNLLGFLYITQLTVKQMLKQKSGNVVSMSAALADRPIAGVNGSVSMITKGGLNSAIRNLAVEYAKEGIRFNAVAPGEVDTPMHKHDANDSLNPLHPMKKIATIKDVVDAVLYLSQAGHVSGEILYVDGGSPARRW
jgi:NAD(P)-dependent dehydrogenase (short-subunit alcohol dehydrogenase family)